MASGLRARAGFTLIEMLAVFVCLGVLAMIALPSFANTRGAAADSVAQQDLLRLQSAMADAYNQAGGYPTSSATWETAVRSDLVFAPTPGVRFLIATTGDGQGARISVRADATLRQCWLDIGSSAPTGGAIACSS